MSQADVLAPCPGSLPSLPGAARGCASGRGDVPREVAPGGGWGGVRGEEKTWEEARGHPKLREKGRIDLGDLAMSFPGQAVAWGG